MSKPYSVRNQPWTNFDKQSYSIFTDDFVHEKLLTFKLNQKPLRGGINLKNTVSRKGDHYVSASQLRLWFPLWNARSGQLYFRSKQDQIKLVYDDGLKQLAKGPFNKYNLYAQYKSNKSFHDIVVKIGASLIAQNYNTENRLRVEFDKSGAPEFSSGHKFSWSKNNFSFDIYELINWGNNSFLKNGLRIGYNKGDNSVFLRAQNQTHRTFKNFRFAHLDSYFNRFILDYVRKVDQLTNVGLQTEFAGNKHEKSSVVLQRSIPNRQAGLKAKVSSEKSVALSYQAVLTDYGKWTAGFQVSDIGRTNKTRYGVQFDLNL